MRLLEYEAKNILRQAQLPTPAGVLIRSDTAPSLPTPIVLKSQVPVGGRGKLGGVVVIDNQSEIKPAIKQLFGLSIKGFTPKSLLAEELIKIKKEHYLSLMIDRSTATIRLIARSSGGVDVESSTEQNFNQAIDSSSLDVVISQLSVHLGYDTSLVQPLVTKLYEVFVQNDMILLEINPLIITTDDQFVCGDCKVELDDMAAFRHSEWQFEDSAQDSNFVTLDKRGAVATIANGAGLAMATVDAVKAKNMTAANFLDIGGGANADGVFEAFKRINEFPDTKAVVINIFAGITRCDEVARAIIIAKEQLPQLPPLCIRLAGTHFEEATTLLSSHDIPTLGTLDECLDAAKEIVYA